MLKKSLAITLACILALSTLARADDLAKSFLNPPDSAKPWVYWFWLDGNITREGITADLQAMKRVGIAGVLIMEVDQGAPKGPARFASPQWRDLYQFMLTEAARLNIEVNMNNDAGWCGSGGPWITPEKAQKKLVFTETLVQGPKKFDALLPQPKPVADWYRDAAVLAFPTPPGKPFRIPHIENKAFFQPRPAPHEPNPATPPASAVIPRGRVLDLTSKLTKDGHLDWSAPEGNWTILRFGYTPTGKDNHPAPLDGRGLECDKLEKSGAQAMFDGLMAKLLADSPSAAPKTLVSTHIDSWEVGSQNWSLNFRAEFTRRRGYDPLPFLPVTTGRVVDSLPVSERFLWDLRQTVSDLLVENYAGHFRTLAHRNNLRLSIEAYDAVPVDEMTYAGQADEPMAEFWSWKKFSCAYSCTEMTSAAHIYGKPIIGAEAFTATNAEKWLGHPANIKDLGDWAFCEGINRFVFHRYALQPWTNARPGMSMGPWGLHYERTQTWWEQSIAWHQYLARCQYLLQQGLFVADILCLQPEGAPMRFSPPPSVRPPGVDRGLYNFDGCTPEVLLTRLSVRNNRLTLPDGMSYRILVLPQTETMTPALLQKIKQLVDAGATVVGPRPQRSPSLSNYPQCDAEVKQLTDELWNSNKNKISDQSPTEALQSLNVPPDFNATDRDSLRYTHRSLDGAEIYFVANKTPHAIQTLADFRVRNKRPELWYPDTGTIELPAAFQQLKHTLRMPLKLDAFASVFVVFRSDVGSFDPVVSITRDNSPLFAISQTPRSIAITSARYGLLSDPKRTRDVTAKLRDLLKANPGPIPVTDLAKGDDPAFGIVKTVQVEYTVDGQPCTASATDTESLNLSFPTSQSPVDLVCSSDDKPLLRTSQPGHYTLTTAAGQVRHIDIPALPQPQQIPGPWLVQFPPNSGAPDQITLPDLISLSKHDLPGVRYFSGTATYRNTFTIPPDLLAIDHRLLLDLGQVEVMADVKLNGKSLGILWKSPYRIDITQAAHPGDNILELNVVNLWINRMIGDEQLPEDSDRNPGGTLKAWPQWLQDGKPSPTHRLTFTSWRLYKANSPLVDSALLGPVQLQSLIQRP